MSNIFHPKILHVSFSISDLSCINSDIPSYTSALAFSRGKVLRILQSRSQAACLIVGLQEKTTYRSMSFPSGGGEVRDAL